MRLDKGIEASFVRVIGMVVFFLAILCLLAVISGVAELSNQKTSESVLFMTFIMCVAFAFMGLMISTLAQVLRSVRRMEALTEKQNKILEDKLVAPAKTVAATPKKTATKKAPAKKAVAKKTTTAKKTTAKKAASKK